MSAAAHEAQVRLYDPGRGSPIRLAVTDADGFDELAGVQPGQYLVEALPPQHAATALVRRTVEGDRTRGRRSVPRYGPALIRLGGTVMTRFLRRPSRRTIQLALVAVTLSATAAACPGEPEPVAVTVTQVVVGADHSCARQSDGTCAAGVTTPKGSSATAPTSNERRPSTSTAWATCPLSLPGGAQTCALLSSGDVRCWETTPTADSAPARSEIT